MVELGWKSGCYLSHLREYCLYTRDYIVSEYGFEHSLAELCDKQYFSLR